MVVKMTVSAAEVVRMPIYRVKQGRYKASLREDHFKY